MTATQPAATVDPGTAIPTLLLAFSADPVIRWLLPGTERYHAALGDFVLLAAGDAFGPRTVDVAYGGAGVAVWARPGTVTDDNGYAELFTRHVDPTRQADVIAWGEQLGSHQPAEPHWHLVALGVDPHRQGQGFGTTLLRRGLERCDRDGLPAYLLSGNPRNRPLYERHGFEVVDEVQVADAPPLWPMLREPRP